MSTANLTQTYAEGAVANLTCTGSMTLTIVQALYGVLSCTACNCAYCNCIAMIVTSKVATLCANSASCSFTAGDIFYGDPCFSYGKNSTIVYYCSWTMYFIIYIDTDFSQNFDLHSENLKDLFWSYLIKIWYYSVKTIIHS